MGTHKAQQEVATNVYLSRVPQFLITNPAYSACVRACIYSQSANGAAWIGIELSPRRGQIVAVYSPIVRHATCLCNPSAPLVLSVNALLHPREIRRQLGENLRPIGDASSTD
ncbi:unnamed protein product [Schistocephalus solidus]|uniref:Uncharacterized protein n=1 Tax=Schistocephalus solidus TaxID=70667 RepID=A0A183TRY6_SCHSO|nr:unnamed protein product [Schistocephalus solidus]